MHLSVHAVRHLHSRRGGMTAFKVRLRVPPSAAKEDSGHRDDADTTMESGDLSADTSAVAVPAEGSAAVDDADDSVTGPTEQGEAVRSSEDVANEGTLA